MNIRIAEINKKISALKRTIEINLEKLQNNIPKDVFAWFQQRLRVRKNTSFEMARDNQKKKYKAGNTDNKRKIKKKLKLKDNEP